MLDQTTKRKLDSARQILVGKVPDPKAQVEQITTALIYKFMDDMDKESEELGGKAKFFTSEFSQYAWSKLLDNKLSGQERLDLYVQAITNMSKNPHISQLFRDVFKGAFLPYNDPRTLSLFLKEINEFSYEHSENLGNAFEYLLSILGSQGDAGQFRTPRHIIDFIVEVVDPKKNETILDPACGTAGFLISAYKHILRNSKIEILNDKLNDEEKFKIQKSKFNNPLTPDEKLKLMNNLAGYDIADEMVKLSRVNMYLHGFPDPKIHVYDTLTSEKRWDETFDVILANPPFMTPKGGIVPHKKFSIKANRSEVLFVDYIMEHLNINGRAGIIVPEGIIFQSNNAYKQLRKKLLEDGLYAVVSLPSGVFNPYAGVKTSILLFDNQISKQAKELLFIKINNDGFDLGAQRREISKNDLPEAVEILKNWKTGKKPETKLAIYVEKSKIAENGDYNLSMERYRENENLQNSSFEMVELGDLIETIIPVIKIQKSELLEKGLFPVVDQGQSFIAGYTDNRDSVIKIIKPVIVFGDHTCAIKYIDFDFAQGSDGIKILKTNEKLQPKYLYYCLKVKPIESDGYKRHFGKLKSFKIPLPPLEIQEQIVKELDGYQKIIDGARQVVESWKPRFEIDPSWEMVEISDENYLKIIDGDRGVNYPKKEEFKKEGYCLFLNTSNVRRGFFDFNNCDFISKERDEKLSKGKF